MCEDPRGLCQIQFVKSEKLYDDHLLEHVLGPYGSLQQLNCSVN